MGQLQYTRKNGKEENKENYDKEELVMIYLNQKHDTTKKYFKHDEVLMPLVLNRKLNTSKNKIKLQNKIINRWNIMPL